MSNETLTIGMVTREFLAVLENTNKMARTINREYSDRFAIDGAKIGDSVDIRKPSRSVGRDGAAMNIEAFRETSVPLVLNHQFGDDTSFSSKELALNIDDFSKRVLGPKVATVSNMVDRLCCQQYKKIANFVGTPESIPNTLLTYLLGGAKLDEECTPMDENRYIMMTPKMQVNIVDALKGLFQQAAAIGEQYRTGRMGTAVGFDWIMDQNVVTHRVGPLGGTPLVNGANQDNTSSLITDGWTAAAANRWLEGDCFNVADVYAVNPQNRDSTGSLRDFVVEVSADSDGSGNLTASIYPSIISSGAFQTVDSIPANNAAITTFGHASSHANKRTPAGMAYHRDFMTLASADLPLPDDNDKAARVSSKKIGYSVRMVRGYIINTDQWPVRLDLLCGAAPLYREWACRVQS